MKTNGVIRCKSGCFFRYRSLVCLNAVKKLGFDCGDPSLRSESDKFNHYVWNNP
jgi:hypothetical protein